MQLIRSDLSAICFIISKGRRCEFLSTFTMSGSSWRMMGKECSRMVPFQIFLDGRLVHHSK